MDGSIFEHDSILEGIFLGFVWDPYRITLESWSSEGLELTG